jgi:hypothetical protein
MQQLLSRIDSKPVPHYVQVYDINSVQQKGAEGPYFNFAYAGSGFADQKTADTCAHMFEQFGQGGWVANDEAEDMPDKPVFDNTKAGGKEDIPF